MRSALMRAVLLGTALLAGGCRPRRAPPPLNVVFIAVDDLRPQLQSYGAPGMKSPWLDALAKRGTLFFRAYCQQALCNPSRSSVLTGMRPDSIDVHSLETSFRTARPELVTMPEYFKKHGYTTRGLGKVFHNGLDDPQSWSVPSWHAHAPLYRTASAQQALAEYEAGRSTKIGPAWEAPEVSDDLLSDGATAQKAVEVLGELALAGRPFFLAIGFSRPHLPMVAPRRYYDLYPSSSVALAANPSPPAGAIDIALTDSDELRHYSGIPESGPIPDEQARDLVRAYMASTSYVDAQIGRVVEAITHARLDSQTIIIVWGDHGFHLGEHGIWAKSTNFEVAARAPLLLAAPQGVPAGLRLNNLVEFVDIYPTLVELAGLPLPSGLEGVSLMPLLADPTRPWKSAAFTQHTSGNVTGHSIRTERYRYTEWRGPTGVTGRELYDHLNDDAENQNLAARPEYGEQVRAMSAALAAGWQAARPPTTDRVRR